MPLDVGTVVFSVLSFIALFTLLLYFRLISLLVSGIPYLNPFYQAMSVQLKDLAGKLRNIGGAQSLDSRKNKSGSVLGSGARDAKSSGLVNPPETVLNEPIPPVQPVVEVTEDVGLEDVQEENS